jgi:hypothetical protein
MPPRLIYNEEGLQDAANVLQYINDYTQKAGITPAIVDANKIFSIIKGAKMDFPHKDGIDEASTFKKVAHFVCYFVAERPLSEPFPASFVGEKIAAIENHQNALMALELAMDALANSTVMKKNDAEKIEVYQIKNRIELSAHSFADVIDALATATPMASFKLVTVLFEQMVYKTNPDCQYKSRTAPAKKSPRKKIR